MNATSTNIQYDLLTGLYNRWKCRLELQRLIDEQSYHVVLSIDLDNFTGINDLYGHPVGDKVILAIARVLTETYPEALIFHITADEFTVILDVQHFSQYQLNLIAAHLFEHLHAVRVEEIADYHYSFSIGCTSIAPGLYTSPDEIYPELNETRWMAKKHEGNFLCTRTAQIPDIEGVFQILREDRRIYNEINSHVFDHVLDDHWFEEQREAALRKEAMYTRNQKQLEDIYAYFRKEDLPDLEYDQLFLQIVMDAGALDAFMLYYMIDNILLPHYERKDPTDSHIRSYLGHLYLLLSDSLISVARMGDDSVKPRIGTLLHQAYDSCKMLPRDSIQFEPAFYALCEMLGHYECLTGQMSDIATCDLCYERLHEMTLGEHPFVVPDAGVYHYFETVVQNAYLFPLYRACYLFLKDTERTEEENRELKERICYIRQHQVDGTFDIVKDIPEMRDMARFLQRILLERHTPEEILNLLVYALAFIHEKNYGTLSEANLTIIAYLFLATSKMLVKAEIPQEQRLDISRRGMNFLIELLRKREAIAADHQMLFLTRVMLQEMMSSPFLPPLDKAYYLEQTLIAISLDTYCHSIALSNYAKVILANVIDHHPELLVGECRPYKSREEVMANRQQLLDYMSWVCRLHDIGKMAMAPVTTNAFRRLTNQEFALIRQHTTLSRNLLCRDLAFLPFIDPVYHHHRWWNEEGGYPDVPEEAKEYPYKIFTDILSICDSIEAATSRIGRNYRRAKSFLQIMDELITEAGNRYSPDIVQTIISSPTTYFEIRQMVDVKWASLYQAIYRDLGTQRLSPAAISDSQLPDIHANSEPSDDEIPSAPVSAIKLPVWLRQMPAEQRDLLTLTLLENTRYQVTQKDSQIFYYQVSLDTMIFLHKGPDGKMKTEIGAHYSEKPMNAYFSHESWRHAVSLLQRIVMDPGFPKSGRRKIDTVGQYKRLVASYTSISDTNGNVMSIIGQLEDVNSTKEKFLATIEQLNHYVSITNSLLTSYGTVIYMDIERKKYEVFKCLPEVQPSIGDFQSGQELIDYTIEHIVHPDYRKAFAAFIENKDINRRYRNKAYDTMEFRSVVSGWSLAHLIPVERDKEGNFTHVIFATENADKAHEEKANLAQMAQYDGLTQVYNRICGEALIREELSRGGAQILAILDCDNLKRINDHLGHLVGDKVIQTQATLMLKVFQEFKVMRLGGDEFVVYANGEAVRRVMYSHYGVEGLFQEFHKEILQVNLPELDGIPPTMSCGVAVCSPAYRPTFEQLYAMADKALYQSKKSRGGAITVEEFHTDE